MNAFIREKWTVQCSETDCFVFSNKSLFKLTNCHGVNFVFSPEGKALDIQFRDGQRYSDFDPVAIEAFGQQAYKYALSVSNKPKAIRGRNASIKGKYI